MTLAALRTLAHGLDATAAALVADTDSGTRGALDATYGALNLLDIRNYGAACDGTTNDVLAVRAAIAEVATLRATGLVKPEGILIPSGRTTRIEVNGAGAEAGIDSGLKTKFAVVVPSSFVVAGAGPSSIVKMTGVPATALGNPDHNSVFGVLNGSRDIVFRDFTAVGENGVDASGFTAVFNNDSAVIDILLNTTQDITVRNVTCKNLYGFSVHDRGENARVNVKDCTFLYCANGVNTNSNHATLSGNTFFHSEGFECSGAGARIVNNDLTDCTGTAISAGGNFSANARRPGSIVALNTVTGGAGQGIVCGDAFVDGEIIANTVRETAKAGILVTATAGAHVNFGNLIALNNVTSCGASTGAAGDAIGISVSGTAGPQHLIGNKSRDGGVAGFNQRYGIVIGSSGTKLAINTMHGTSYDIEIVGATDVALDDTNTYASLSLVSGATVAPSVTKNAATHRGVETFEHHLAAVHPAAGASNFSAAAGAAATAAARAGTGTDTCGQVNYSTTGGTTGELFTVKFGRAYTSAPRIFLQVRYPQQAAAGLYVSTRSITGFTVSCVNAHASGGGYECHFFSMGS